MLIYGINPVIEALRAGRVTSLLVSARTDERLREVLRLASARGIPARRVDGATLDRVSRGGAHQGAVAEIRAADTYSVADLIRDVSGPALIVVLDSIEDPQNVGAILRTVDAAGAHGLVRQTRHAARLDGAAMKASAGAIAHVRIAEVVNIARAIEELKELGVWSVGLAGEAPQRYDAVDLTVPTALVLGAEGPGLRRLIRERCDVLASIPMLGHVTSLNVSVAAGIVLFEAIRQRTADPPARR
jgi:23S rRNA (guanosine2251-2'-O)-methyltransferase